MKEVGVTIAHGLAGWALCGVTMGAAMATTTLSRALVIHALATPVIFGVVTLVRFKVLRYGSALRTALVFVAVVILMDVFVVALVIERSFRMFASPLGTWIPFTLIFLSSWGTGVLVAPPGRG
jgi:hypothetical protein